MIKDCISNSCCYKALGFDLDVALDYLATTDFAVLPPGKYEVQGQRVFAIVQRYQTKPRSEIVWEAHRRYIDVQYVVEGIECMGCVSRNTGPQVTHVYDPDKDAEFYSAIGDELVCRQGDFVIFTPQDIHAPGLAVEGASRDVLKVVVKVQVNTASGACGF